MSAFEDTVNEVADTVLLLGFIPFAAFTLDYVLVRPFRRYEPWWRSAIGWMFATLGMAVVLMGGVVLLSLFLGTHYTGRPVVRLIGYAAFTLAGVMLCVVYFTERGSAEPVLFHKRKRANR